MRHPSLVPLSHDHHHGLALALRCRKQALGQIKPIGAAGLAERAKEFSDFYRQNLVAHFRAEEDTLFPWMQANIAESAPIIDELMRQHEDIRQFATRIDAGQGLAKLIFDIGDLLERHIRKEERELFPLFEAQVAPDDAEQLGAKIKRTLEHPAT
jgi:iron-sulfur cluster repair protein YtfE (RIC family)